MQIGQLNQRVLFERPKRAADGGGGADITWVPAMTVWGSLAPERGREVLAAGRLESSSAGILTIRSSREAETIDASYRATIDDVAYQIRSIANPDQHNRFLEMVVERGVGL